MTVLGIDVGDDRVTAVAVDESGRVLTRASESSRDATLAAAVRDVYRRVGAVAARAPVGVAAPFDPSRVPADAARMLASESGQTPVGITRGHASVLAEAWCGAATGVRNVIAFAIAEHVTAGILVDGRLLQGANGHAGAVAWLTLNPVEREDYRRLGGLEAEVAAAGIVRRLVWRIKSGDESRVVERVDGELGRLTADDVIAAAREGDGVCLSVIRDTAKYVGMAVSNLAAVVDPELIVLGGTLASSGDLMLDAIRAECARRLSPSQGERVRIELSTLGDDGPAIGAARAVLLDRQ